MNDRPHPPVAADDAAAVQAPGALLFDLGRVVIRIDQQRMFAHWAAAASVPADLLAQRYRACERYEAHERGEIDDAVWFAVLRERLGVAIDDAAFTAGWQAMLAEVEPEVVDVIGRLRGRLPIFAFTNTNRTHRQQMDRDYADTMALFDHVFDSSQMGQRKPEPAAFRSVVEKIGMPASRILFFDDLPANVQGARSVGLRAVQVRSPADVLAALAPLLVRGG